MASTLVSTLYPPQVDTFMPAFINTQSAEIKFSISPYNNLEDIKHLHITVVDNNSNQSVLQSTDLGALNGSIMSTLGSAVVVDEVLILPFDFNSKTSSGLFSVEIPRKFLKKTDLESDEPAVFKPDQYYKVQLRFDGTPTKNLGTGALTTDYLIENRQFFSEWSSVCLIRPISQPSLVLNRFSRPETIVSYNQGSIPIYGYLSFEDASSQERLQAYKFKLIDAGGNVIDDTGLLYPTTGSNSINCLLDADNTSQGAQYMLSAYIITKNQYEMSQEYTIKINDYDSYTFEPEITIKENAEDGLLSINVATHRVAGGKYSAGKLYVKRASSKDNFKKWELISCTEEPATGAIDRTIVDGTVASMYRYQYSVQLQYAAENSKLGTWSVIHKSDIIYPTFYDMLLSRKDTQLAIRYNGQVSSMKPVSVRTKFDTLGSKYPKFAENAQLNYKQYSISGLISAEGDFNRTFLSELSELYYKDIEAYDKAFGASYMMRNDTVADGVQESGGLYQPQGRVDCLKNTLHDVYPHDNWYWEREFREQVVAWLNDGEVKLFRSAPEGNMAVMVTDVNLTPNQSIGRMLYSFTATMYEVGDGYSLEALDNIGVIDIPDAESNITTGDMYDAVGNDTSTIVAGTQHSLRQVIIENSNGQDVFNSLREELVSEYSGVRSDLLPNVDDILALNIQVQFTSKPQWYRQLSNGTLSLVDNPAEETGLSNLLFGYALMYQTNLVADSYWETLFVNDKGFYQFPSEQKIRAIKLDNGASAMLTFVAEYEEGTSIVETPTETYIEDRIIGQLSGMFNCKEWLADTIKDKYEFTCYKNEYGVNTLLSKQYLSELENIVLDVSPYSVFEVLYNNETQANRLITGRSGVYNLDSDYVITDIRFLGRRMFLNQDADPEYLDSWEYRIAANESEKNTRNAVYNGKINFNGIEYDFQETSDSVGLASIPIEGYLNYVGNLIRSEYV